MKTIRCVMLDLGGVLAFPQRRDKVLELMDLMGCGAGIDAFLAAYARRRRDYDRGDLDRPSYWASVAEELGVASPLDLAALSRVDLESWFNIRPRVIDFVRGLRGRVRSRVLLSNIHADGARFVRSPSCESWSSDFEGLILSAELGLAKPERGIYEAAVRAAGVPASDCLFVDDIEANAEGARRAGLESFRFEDEEDFLTRVERDYEYAR